ncbi:hypothetical protein J1614_011197 [Plenodomus biglobosus]|nr:hypothetical protein J1614_011197 [Plenodomus biglobosus]
MSGFQPNDPSKMDSTLSVKVPIKIPHTKKQNRVTNWFKKIFISPTETNYSHTSRQTTVGGAIWATSSTIYPPNRYFELDTGSEICYHGPVSRSRSPFPHARSESSHAYSMAINETSPTVSSHSEQSKTPAMHYHNALSGSVVHPSEDTTLPHSKGSSRKPSAPEKPQCSNTRKPPNMTYFEYLSSMNHQFPKAHSEISHAYGGHTYLAPPRPRTLPRNINKDLPKIPYREVKPKYPCVPSESSHAYDAHSSAGPSSLSLARARDRTLEQLCEESQTRTPMYPARTKGVTVDWERDWDVPLSQRLGSGKVLYQTKGKGIQIRNRESVVAVKGKEQRDNEGRMLRGEWKREDGRGKGKCRQMEADHPFEGDGGKETDEIDEDGEGMEMLERSSSKRCGITGQPPL